MTEADTGRRLLAAFRDRRVAKREAAIPALAGMKTPPVAELRAMAASSPHTLERRCALTVLLRLRDRSLPRLARRALRDPGMSLRRVGMMAVAAEGGAGAARTLLPLLRDESGGVRVLCAGLLGDLDERCAVPALIRALGDGQWYVRQAAALALLKLKDPRARTALNRATRDPRKCVSEAARRALGAMGGGER